MSKNTNTNNTEKLVTINSKSKEFTYKTFSTTNVVAWTINPVDMKTVKRDFFFSGNLIDGIDYTGVAFDKIDEVTKDYLRVQCQKQEECSKCMVVRVEGYVIKEHAIAETIEDYIKNGVSLVKDEQSRWCLPSDYREQLKEMHDTTIRLVKDEDGFYKLPDNINEIIERLNSNK